MNQTNTTVLITGCAGFIGMHTSLLFLNKGFHVVGVDNMNDYYNPILKEKRLAEIQQHEHFTFMHIDIGNFDEVDRVISEFQPSVIIHLAAQAGVRYSLQDPWTYIQSNVMGTTNIFESARRHEVSRVIYASSSSTYGRSEQPYFKESDPTDHPVSLYAATKKSTEVIAYAYHSLYNISAIGLRFFTVYGPYDRPDMAPFIFSRKMLSGESIDVFAGGELERDFTYIDDITEGIWGAYNLPNSYGYDIFNLGGNKTHSVNTFITHLEESLKIKATRNEMPFQQGDVPKTSASIEKSSQLLGYQPKTPLNEGIKKRSDWFLENWDWLKEL